MTTSAPARAHASSARAPSSEKPPSASTNSSPAGSGCVQHHPSTVHIDGRSGGGGGEASGRRSAAASAPLSRPTSTPTSAPPASRPALPVARHAPDESRAPGRRRPRPQNASALPMAVAARRLMVGARLVFQRFATSLDVGPTQIFVEGIPGLPAAPERGQADRAPVDGFGVSEALGLGERFLRSIETQQGSMRPLRASVARALRGKRFSCSASRRSAPARLPLTSRRTRASSSSASHPSGPDRSTGSRGRRSRRLSRRRAPGGGSRAARKARPKARRRRCRRRLGGPRRRCLRRRSPALARHHARDDAHR